MSFTNSSEIQLINVSKLLQIYGLPLKQVVDKQTIINYTGQYSYLDDPTTSGAPTPG